LYSAYYYYRHLSGRKGRILKHVNYEIIVDEIVANKKTEKLILNGCGFFLYYLFIAVSEKNIFKTRVTKESNNN
jgi:hypothetical protein